MGPGKTEISENEVNYACSHINLTNVTGAMIGKEGSGKKNALALPIQVLIDDVCVCFLGGVGMSNT